MFDEIRYSDYKSGYSFKQRAAPGYKKTSVKYSRRSEEDSDINDFSYKGRNRSGRRGDSFRNKTYSGSYDADGRMYDRVYDRPGDRSHDSSEDKKISRNSHHINYSYEEGDYRQGDGSFFFFKKNEKKEKDGRNRSDSSDSEDSPGESKKTDKTEVSSESTEQDGELRYNPDIRYGDMEYISDKEKFGYLDVKESSAEPERKYLFDDKDAERPKGNIKYYAAKRGVEYAKKIGKSIKENAEENSGGYNDGNSSHGFINVERAGKSVTNLVSTIIGAVAALLTSSLPILLPMMSGVLIIIIVSAISFQAFNSKSKYTAGGGFSAEVESWRSTVIDRCDYYKDSYKDFDTTQFVNAILATIDQESNGISSGCGGDLMQSRESGYWTSGTPSDWDKFSTEKKSIDAGCRYFFSGVKAWGVDDPGDYDGLQIVAQGYNLGTAYLEWMKDLGETKWSKSTAETYSNKMKSQLGVSAYGNPSYGEQWLAKYMKGNISTYSGDFADLEGTYIFQQGSGPCCSCGVADMIYRYLYMCGDTNWDSFNPEMTTDDGIALYDLITDGQGGTTASWGRFDSQGNIHCETKSGWNTNDYFTATIHGITFTVNDSNWTGFASDEDAKQYLQQHPEGVAVYNGLHCTVLTRYDEASGEFYCVDPGQWGSSSIGNPASDADGRKEIPLSESGSHAVKSISEIKGYWFIESGQDNASPGDGTEE